MGLFPSKPKDHQVLYDAVLRHQADRGMFTGFEVEDAAVEEECKTRTMKIAIHNLLEDSKGVPNPTCSKVCPATNGMCPCCRVKGMKVFKRPCYLGAATRLYGRYALKQLHTTCAHTHTYTHIHTQFFFLQCQSRAPKSG